MIFKIDVKQQSNSAKCTITLSFGDEATTGDKIVSEINKIMADLIASNQIPGGKIVKIDGPCTVAGAYVIATWLKPLYGAIAIADPKLRLEDGSNQYIVVVSRDPYYRVGSVIGPEAEK